MTYPLSSSHGSRMPPDPPPPPASGDGAWTAQHSNVGQSITVDLGEVYRITRVATQGRRNSKEWVLQYNLQYGFNGRDFMDYRGPHGGAWVSCDVGFVALDKDSFSAICIRLCT